MAAQALATLTVELPLVHQQAAQPLRGLLQPDEVHGDADAASSRFRAPRHVQQDQVLAGGLGLGVGGGGGPGEDEVEAVEEGDGDEGAGRDLDGGRPAVRRAGEVGPERLDGADEAAAGARAAERSVRAHAAVVGLVVVCRPGVAAVGGVGARDADGLHQGLHGAAPVVHDDGDAAHVALFRWCELVAARRANRMALVALHHQGAYGSICVSMQCTRM